MTFGPQVSAGESRAMVQYFFEAGFNELDTAYVYNKGETERILGSILAVIPDESLCIATKVNPRITGRLDGEAVKIQFSESLRRLAKDSVDILYLHFPDSHTPVESALEMCANLHAKGKFKELGVSNFPAWMVVDIWHICRERGWPKPVVYQGLYNGLSRKVENELFPALRKLGIRFYAFNPLAGGLLSGKYSSYEETPVPGRFTARPNYLDRYWKRSYFDAIKKLEAVCQETEIPLAEAAYRWLSFHSCLDSSRGDGILVGASNIKHLNQNLKALDRGVLPKTIEEAFNKAWEETKSDCPDYFKFYTK